jgi:formylglycine-generating enzyme required for sulfatase activity
VERVRWEHAQEFVRKLSEKTGQTYRLPTESEWEYACRAGGTFAYCGSDEKDKVAFNEQRDGWNTHPVARKQANAFGLFDMSGSVWEWTEDCWHDDYKGAPNDGSAWVIGESCQWSRLARGGSWRSGPRSAAERGFAKSFWDTRGRNNRDPAIVGATFGVRPARALP